MCRNVVLSVFGRRRRLLSGGNRGWRGGRRWQHPLVGGNDLVLGPVVQQDGGADVRLVDVTGETQV